MQMSPLFTTTSGQGKPLLVLHGWGMNQQVWQPVWAQLAAVAEVTYVDLPGHGQSGGVAFGSLDELVQQLGELIQPDTVIMGWSLGGLAAQALAKAYPQRVKGLVLVASTPRFLQSADWVHGLSVEVLQGFADNLQQNYQATVKRFFTLQFMGVRHDATALWRLQQEVMSQPADPLALQHGLDMLATADFTDNRPAVPVLWLFGKLDRLIPFSLADVIEQWGGDNRITVLDKAAHVPFVTHPQPFLEAVVPFVDAIHNSSQGHSRTLSDA